MIVLKWVFAFVQNYSVAIILVTIAIRLLILPLDLRQKKSTRKMALIQPKLESLKKRYANNPQQMQKKQQELYKKEGVRPLAGCLPMLITLPIFFAFFGAMRVLAAEQTVSFMLNAQQLGQQAFDLPRWLWVNNFWQPDAGHEPILMAGARFAEFVQQNSSYINPQSLHLMADSGLLSYGSAVTAGPLYSGLSADIIAANGVVGVNNGWYILPILAGGTLFLQQKISMGQSPQMQGQGKFMLWFFPLFSIYICVISNTAFSLYWLSANLYALAQLLVLNYIYKMRDKKNKPEVVEEGI